MESCCPSLKSEFKRFIFLFLFVATVKHFNFYFIFHFIQFQIYFIFQPCWWHIMYTWKLALFVARVKHFDTMCTVDTDIFKFNDVCSVCLLKVCIVLFFILYNFLFILFFYIVYCGFDRVYSRFNHSPVCLNKQIFFYIIASISFINAL